MDLNNSIRFIPLNINYCGPKAAIATIPFYLGAADSEIHAKYFIYSVSLPPSSDISTKTRLVSTRSHTNCCCVCVSRCALFHLGGRQLALGFLNKYATSLLGGREVYTVRLADFASFLLD